MATEEELNARIAALTEELKIAKQDVWMSESRLNCLLLDNPLITPRSGFCGNSQYLAYARDKIDAHMRRMVEEHASRHRRSG